MRRHKKYVHGEVVTDLENYLLKGPVKQVMETRYKAHLRGGEIIQGKMEVGSGHDETNFIETYNQAGRRIQQQLYGSVFSDIVTYNDKGLRIERLQYYHGNFHSKTTNTYNEAGRVIDHVYSDKDGNINSRTVHTYTDIGQNLETITYRGNEMKLGKKTGYTYADKILVINGISYRKNLSTIEYNEDGSIHHQFLHKYDKDGNEIESITEYMDEKEKKYNKRTTYKLNQYGDCIESNHYGPDGTLTDTYTNSFEYDSEGKKIIKPHEPFDPYALKPGETETFEYDHHDNWIKKTCFFENKPISISLRQYCYYGEPSDNEAPFVHPFTLQAPDEIIDVNNQTEELEPEQAKWLAEGTNSSELFPVHRYYAMMFNEIASTINYANSYIEGIAFLKLLENDLDAQIVHSTANTSSGWGERYTRYTLSFRSHRGYLIQANNLSGRDGDEYEVPSHVKDLIGYDDNVYFGQFQLFRPSEASGKRDEYFEETIEELIEQCTLRRKPETPFINIVEVSGNSFAMAEHPVDDAFEIRDLDVNYGYGFNQFHTELIDRFKSSTKGLVLFHGEPGTGKTFYIRHLLRKMVANNKVVIYMPPNMVDHLVEPGFMTFLMQSVRNWSADGNFCVLLIEDAEPLLAKRQEGVRIQGVTNLLNLSDGLLNDMLNLQIICTFNVDLKKLDSALLRPGRLIARKEFKALSELDANLLAQRLGIKHHFKGPATLGEIYALRKNQNTLIHDVAPDRDASTILDDL